MAEFFTTLVSVVGGDMPALLDEDGSAVIIHEHPDDHLTQPIGGAGGRIACGVIASLSKNSFRLSRNRLLPPASLSGRVSSGRCRTAMASRCR